MLFGFVAVVDWCYCVYIVADIVICVVITAAGIVTTIIYIVAVAVLLFLLLCHTHSTKAAFARGGVSREGVCVLLLLLLLV